MNHEEGVPPEAEYPQRFPATALPTAALSASGSKGSKQNTRFFSAGTSGSPVRAAQGRVVIIKCITPEMKNQIFPIVRIDKNCKIAPERTNICQIA